MVSRQYKILVVEDEPHALEIVVSFLKGAAYEVVPAYGGADALRKVDKEDFDLILTDLAMPDVDGLKVIDTIKSDPERKHIPIIAVTAFSDWERIRQSATELGCDGFVSKPVDGRELIREVRTHLARVRQSRVIR